QSLCVARRFITHSVAPVIPRRALPDEESRSRHGCHGRASARFLVAGKMLLGMTEGRADQNWVAGAARARSCGRRRSSATAPSFDGAQDMVGRYGRYPYGLW